MPTRPTGCLFCEIANGVVKAHIVFEDAASLAFLDHRPLFPGHALLIPRQHYDTFYDLPADDIGLFFRNAQLLAQAIERAIKAEGTFVASNNRVSQSVPHLHVHIVPRRKGDGLKGFFWPRKKYSGEDEMRAVADRIRVALTR